MDSFLLLTLTVALMFAGGHCYSQSMSCSTVNGKMICEKQTGSGNIAGAFAGSSYGAKGAYQDAAAMTGNTRTGQSHSSRTSVDPFRGFGVPNFYANRNAGWMPASGHLIGTGASDATSFNSNTGNGISTSGFAGTSNNNGFPGPAFGGFAVADSNGNSFYGGGNPYGGGNAYGGNAHGGGNALGGGYGHGYGNPSGFVFSSGNSNGFDPSQIFASVGLGGANFPFNIFGRKR